MRSSTAQSAPLLDGVEEAVVFSSIRSDLLLHRHHYIANWLAERWPTTWVDTLGLRTARLSDIRRLGGERAGQSTSSLVDSINVIRPGTIPIHGSRLIHSFNSRLLQRRMRKASVEPERSLAWVYLPHPALTRVLTAHRWRAIVFDLCDDFADFEHVHSDVVHAERWLIEHANVTVASSIALQRKARNFKTRDLCYVPNGVDASRFSRASPWSGNVRTVTYIGSVFEWFDERLLADVASARPDLEFRVVGPVRRPLRMLRSMSNVALVGPIAASDVPRELDQCDLCVVPFRRGSLIEATDPLKVYEALAAGRPVLATPMPMLERFLPFVRLEADALGWLSAIRNLESGSWCFDSADARTRVMEIGEWRARFRQLDEAVLGNDVTQR